MFLFNIFKRKKELQERRRITFQTLDLEIEIELKNIEKKIQDIGEQTKQKILQLISEIKEHILNLKSINLEERKEQEKIKVIVKENLNLYISYLQKFIEQLEALDYKDKDYFKKIDSVFNSFKIVSTKSFGKATILIGKELDEVRESMKRFSRNFDTIMNENREYFEKEQIAIVLKNLMSELKNKKNAEAQLANFLQKLEQTLKELEENEENLKKSLENVKKSEEYAKSLEEKERFKQRIEKLEQEIFKLKQNIDFKHLLKYFHQDKKKSALIKKYVENFKEALEHDARLEIMDIIKEISPQFNFEKLKEIRQINIELKDWKEPVIDKQLRNMEEEIKRLNLKIQGLKNEIEQERKKNEKFQAKEKEIRQEIKNQAKILWKDIEICD